MAMTLFMVPNFIYATPFLSSLSGDPFCDTSGSHACNESGFGSEPIPEDNNCCESDCQHCGLPCCAGAVMVPALALAFILTSDGSMPANAIDLPWVDTEPLYHPPRG